MVQKLFSRKKATNKNWQYFTFAQVVGSGVPQGSVLSATLFLIFIKDFLEVTFNGQISAFADYVSFFCSFIYTDMLGQKMSRDLKLLKIWCEVNKMEVNASKTNIINFDFPTKYHKSNCFIRYYQL